MKKDTTTPRPYTFRNNIIKVSAMIHMAIILSVQTATANPTVADLHLFSSIQTLSESDAAKADTTFGVFTEITPADSLFVTPADEDFWVNATAPADYDNDGDLDIAVIGYYVVYNVGVDYKLVLMRNEGEMGVNAWDFSYIDVPLGTLYSGSTDMAWGDADGDGDLDLVVGSNNQTVLYINDGGSLAQSSIQLPGYWEDNSQAEFDLRSISWADYDNDGDHDLLIPSVYEHSTFSFRTALMRNDGMDSTGTLTFTETAPVVDETNHAQTAWADMDADQDLDLLVVNIAPIYNNSFIRLYKNEGDGLFTEEDILGSLAVVYGEAQWGDYDGDGDLDILIAGGVEETNGTYTHMVVRIYRNDNGSYFPIEAVTDPVAEGWIDISAATWADYDSDGDMDIMVAGNYNSGTNIEGRARIYSNNGGAFTDSGTELPAPRASGDMGGTFSWLDIDSDGDLDYYISGQYFVPGGNGLVESQMHLYRNDTPVVNLSPLTPSGLVSTLLSDNAIKLLWNPGEDDHTPAAAITYDLKLFRDDSPVYLPTRTPEPGNISAVNEWVLSGLSDGTYKWVIRAVDAAFTGSDTVTGEFHVGEVTTRIQEAIPVSFMLGQNYPNPFNSKTNIHFSLPVESKVTVQVFGLLGNVISTPMLQSDLGTGEHELSFDAGNLPEGIYYYRIEAGQYSATRKMIVKK